MHVEESDDARVEQRFSVCATATTHPAQELATRSRADYHHTSTLMGNAAESRFVTPQRETEQTHFDQARMQV
jgi:hypothetical protein